MGKATEKRSASRLVPFGHATTDAGRPRRLGDAGGVCRHATGRLEAVSDAAAGPGDAVRVRQCEGSDETIAVRCTAGGRKGAGQAYVTGRTIAAEAKLNGLSLTPGEPTAYPCRDAKTGAWVRGRAFVREWEVSGPADALERLASVLRDFETERRVTRTRAGTSSALVGDSLEVEWVMNGRVGRAMGEVCGEKAGIAALLATRARAEFKAEQTACAPGDAKRLEAAAANLKTGRAADANRAEFLEKVPKMVTALKAAAAMRPAAFGAYAKAFYEQCAAHGLSGADYLS